MKHPKWRSTQPVQSKTIELKKEEEKLSKKASKTKDKSKQKGDDN